MGDFTKRLRTLEHQGRKIRTTRTMLKIAEWKRQHGISDVVLMAFALEYIQVHGMTTHFHTCLMKAGPSEAEVIEEGWLDQNPMFVHPAKKDRYAQLVGRTIRSYVNDKEANELRTRKLWSMIGNRTTPPLAPNHFASTVVTASPGNYPVAEASSVRTTADDATDNARLRQSSFDFSVKSTPAGGRRPVPPEPEPERFP